MDMSWNFDLRTVISISFRHNSTHYSISLLVWAMWIESFTFLYLHFSKASIHTIFIGFFHIYCLNLYFLIICHLVTDIIRKQTSSNSLSRFRICFSCVYVRWKKKHKKNIEIYCRNLYVKSRLRNNWFNACSRCFVVPPKSPWHSQFWQPLTASTCDFLSGGILWL